MPYYVELKPFHSKAHVSASKVNEHTHTHTEKTIEKKKKTTATMMMTTTTTMTIKLGKKTNGTRSHGIFFAKSTLVE